MIYSFKCNEEGVHIELTHLAIEGNDMESPRFQDLIYQDDYGFDYMAYQPSQDCFRLDQMFCSVFFFKSFDHNFQSEI